MFRLYGSNQNNNSNSSANNNAELLSDGIVENIV